MSKELKAYIDKIKNTKAEQLCSLTIDIAYFNNMLSLMENEEELRKKLEDENKKIPPQRNADVVKTLEQLINKITEIKNKRNQFQNMYLEVSKYLEYINNLDADMLSSLDKMLSK